MLKIENLSTSIDGKDILKNFYLNINDGEVHALMGPNGTGKSTLSKVILNNKKYKKLSGKIMFDDVDITNMSTDEIARKGIFLCNQLPCEIDGVTTADFLRTALNEKEDFIMLPTVDFCFKELMQNENVRKGIIAAILNKRPDEIVNTELLPTILRKDSEDDKYGILDVRVQLDNEVQIDFEMQVVYYDFWANRTIYYLSKMYTEQIREGDSYDRLQKCIQVSILAHVLFQEDDECYRRISFCDVKTGKEYTDLMEMHILELPKLPPEQKSETDLMQWMRFLNGKRREDFEKMAKKNSCFEEAYKELDKLSADEKKRLEYEARQKAIRDRDILIKTGENRGRKEIILSMIEAGLPLEQIAEITKETLETIQELKKKMG